jgi:formylglycine-generating enzyme required for sulfatase activity
VEENETIWANCNGCGDTEWDNAGTAPVGKFPANGFGLHDTAGNVYEWVEDCWHDSYQNAPGNSSAWLYGDGGDCGRRVLRGGSWASGPRDVRSANRIRFPPDARNSGIGVRLAQDID